MLDRVISGGQTGVDQAALCAPMMRKGNAADGTRIDHCEGIGERYPSI